MDSEVTFEDDPDEEMDTTTIEEEWIDFIKRSDCRCIGQDGTCKDSMLEQDPQKNEMEIGTENCKFTEWKMAEKGCWMEQKIWAQDIKLTER